MSRRALRLKDRRRPQRDLRLGLAKQALDRFVDAYVRWLALTERTHDVCPFCKAAVIVEPGADGQDFHHTSPVCPPWVPAFFALGGTNVRETEQ